MTAVPSPKDASPSSSSSPDHSGPNPSPWPRPDSPGTGHSNAVERQQAVEAGAVSWESQSILSETQRLWWKTRRAKVAYAAGALLLVVFVLLLALGLSGYLRKVGSFAIHAHALPKCLL